MKYLHSFSSPSEKLLGNIDAICFPSRDEDGLPTDRISEDKIILDCLIGCYHEFNKGEDFYPEQLDDLKTSLMDNLGVDLDYLQSQKQQSEDLQKQLQEINPGGNKLQELRVFRANRLSDIEKIEEVTRQMEDRVLHYKDRTKRTVEKQCDLTTKIQVSLAPPTFDNLLKTFSLLRLIVTYSNILLLTFKKLHISLFLHLCKNCLIVK